jgi:hypothetical protein
MIFQEELGVCQLIINKGCVTRGVALPFTLKSTLRERKRKITETQILHHAKNRYNLQKKLSKRNQNPSKYRNSITNLKFQHKPHYHLSKILI